jgi:hypothetical protein
MTDQQLAAIPNEAETTAIAPVPPPLEQQPNDPGPQGWNPPTGDEDFDSLFQRIGVDGENLTNSNTVPTELTTAPEEPAPQEVPEAPPAKPSWTELKTKTGTVYKTAEDAIQGIETKDNTIAQLRSMIAAVTGEDPLSKSGAKPGTTNAPQKPVSYLQDEARFAQDLTQAAELGQKTNDWKAYRNVQAQLAYEVVQSAVGAYIPVVQKVGKQEAIEAVAKELPEFRNFYGSQEYQKVLEQRPKLAGYIKTLEGNATMQEDLAEQYRDVWNEHQVKKLAELASKPVAVVPNPTPRTPLKNRTPDFRQEPNDGMRRQQPASKPTLATAEGRKALIEELEKRGLADVSF